MKSFDDIWEKIHATQEWGKYPSEPVIRFVARNYYAKDRKAVRILDFGCGAGSHTWYLAKEGFDTYAFDGSESAMKKVRDRLEEEGLAAHLMVRDALELDYPKDYFDCVIDNAAIYANRYEHIVRMYQNVYEILKPGGMCFSISFSTETTGYGSGKELEKQTFCDLEEGCLKGRGVSHFYKKDDLSGLLLEVGFQHVIIDTMKYTDRGELVAQFLVQAEK